MWCESVRRRVGGGGGGGRTGGRGESRRAAPRSSRTTPPLGSDVRPSSPPAHFTACGLKGLPALLPVGSPQVPCCARVESLPQGPSSPSDFSPDARRQIELLNDLICALLTYAAHHQHQGTQILRRATEQDPRALPHREAASQAGGRDAYAEDWETPLVHDEEASYATCRIALLIGDWGSFQPLRNSLDLEPLLRSPSSPPSLLPALHDPTLEVQLSILIHDRHRSSSSPHRSSSKPGGTSFARELCALSRSGSVDEGALKGRRVVHRLRSNQGVEQTREASGSKRAEKGRPRWRRGEAVEGSLR